MHELKLNQSDLAERLGCTRARVSLLLHQSHSLNLRTIFRVAEALECDVTLQVLKDGGVELRLIPRKDQP
jgi:transcriptional regulator with XRE-family HTH domain